MRGRKRHVKKWAKQNAIQLGGAVVTLGAELARQVYAKSRNMALVVRVGVAPACSETFSFGSYLLSTAGFSLRRSALCATATPTPGPRRAIMGLQYSPGGA